MFYLLKATKPWLEVTWHNQWLGPEQASVFSTLDQDTVLETLLAKDEKESEQVSSNS